MPPCDDIVCQLCGVTFAIARIRRADEPEEAAWDHEGADYYVDECELDERDVICGKPSGCTSYDREGCLGEHLAGPGCVSERGYSGHRISVAEMNGCRAVQCLVQKGKTWMPEDDDEDFEIEGDFYLTGFGECPWESAPLEGIEPVRHGISSIWVQNRVSYCDPDWYNPVWHGLPFHPTCFEIYKKVCKMRMGRIDSEGLFFWHFLDRYSDLQSRDGAVSRAREDQWKHEPGSEYLAANPIDVPGMSQLLEPPVCIAGKKTTFGSITRPDGSRMRNHRTLSLKQSMAQDLFSKLPAEVNGMILDHLGSTDIASLRLATPVFRQLPITLFRRLLLEDMPWMFEVRDVDRAGVDWYEFYCRYKFGWKDLKGLRNRRRIWRAVEEMVGKIQRFRGDGTIEKERKRVLVQPVSPEEEGEVFTDAFLDDAYGYYEEN